MVSREKFSLVLLTIAATLSVCIYLLVSRYTYRTGFPLDDAWIHQTYARNIAASGTWSFIPGEPSGGSTAPLWSSLLAVGYLIRLAPFAWSYFLGWICLGALTLCGYFGFRVLAPSYQRWAILAGILLAFEWHLVWSSVSGMETTLFTLVVFFVLILLASGMKRWFWFGMLIGLSLWVRPDGLTLLAPALLCLVAARDSLKQKAGYGLLVLLGFLLLVIPYFLLQWKLTGNWMPNTFYAKQAEYAIALKLPLWERLANQASMPMIGVGIILLPGFLVNSWKTLRAGQWSSTAGVFWAVGYLGLYAFRLPVTYQHGRYVIPMMPIYFTWGLAGMVGLLQMRSPVLWKRVLSRSWLISAIVVLFCFWVIGARAYGKDVAVIESEMVDTAHWVAANTEPDALIAAHDIGALGYFGNRRLLDLAGLVSPQVIPFMRNEDRLAQFLNENGANYLVTFPGWYPYLVTLAKPVYETNGSFSPQQGGENMVVYRWGTP